MKIKQATHRQQHEPPTTVDHTLLPMHRHITARVIQ